MARVVSPDARQLAARIPKRLHRAVKLAALNAGVTTRDWIADALEAHLRRCQRPRGDAAKESSLDG